MMKFKFVCHKFVTTVLFLASAAPAFGETVADGAAEATSPEHHFAVASANKNKTHPHYDKGADTGFVVNGVQGGTLVLVRGKTYTFDVNTGVMHDFYLATKPMGFGTGTLTKGVKGNFTYKGLVTLTPTAGTPDIIYYACRNHKFMGGEIHVVNRGEEGKLKDVKSALKP
ncbi:MAG: hypothetical protein WAW75_00055 [Gallionella sp.]